MAKLAGGLSTRGLPIGSNAPIFEATDHLSDQRVGVQIFRGRGGVILFLTPTCPMCADLVSKLVGAEPNQVAVLLAICRSGRTSCVGFLSQLNRKFRTLVDETGETAKMYDVTAFPTAVVVDSELKIRAYGHPKDLVDITGLVRRTLPQDAEVANAPIPAIQTDPRIPV
jgi:peroxiredoxin